MVKYKNEEGYVFEVYSSLYVDWGLRINAPDGTEVMDSPSFLSNESYGHKPHPRYAGDWDNAEKDCTKGDDTAFVLWDDKDWKECLATEADDLLDFFLPEGE